MAVTRITNTRRASGAVDYVLKPKVENKERVLLATGLNVDERFASEQMDATREAYGKNGVNPRNGEKYVQAYRLIQSFGDKELDPKNPEDIEMCHKLGRKLAIALYPDHEVLIVTHGDGKGGKLHNHLVVNATSFLTGQQIRGKRKDWKNIARVSDQILRDNGMEPLGETNTAKDSRTKGEMELAANGEYVWKDDLKDRINSVLETETVGNQEDFVDEMKEKYNVAVAFRGEKGISYAFEDDDGKKRISRGKKLGTDYQKEAILGRLNENEAIVKADNSSVAVPRESLRQDEFNAKMDALLNNKYTQSKPKEKKEMPQEIKLDDVVKDKPLEIVDERAEKERMERLENERRQRELKAKQALREAQFERLKNEFIENDIRKVSYNPSDKEYEVWDDLNFSIPRYRPLEDYEKAGLKEVKEKRKADKERGDSLDRNDSMQR